MHQLLQGKCISKMPKTQGLLEASESTLSVWMIRIDRRMHVLLQCRFAYVCLSRDVLNTLPPKRRVHHFHSGAHSPLRRQPGTVKVPWSAPVAGFFSWMVSEGKSTKGSSWASAETALMDYKEDVYNINMKTCDFLLNELVAGPFHSPPFLMPLPQKTMWNAPHARCPNKIST